ncbi:MAG: hypothetical protein LBB09_02740, partial [Rickettsiales bacterium]|nr:hypothetical protein [Rickettsiales bacterium]
MNIFTKEKGKSLRIIDSMRELLLIQRDCVQCRLDKEERDKKYFLRLLKLLEKRARSNGLGGENGDENIAEGALETNNDKLKEQLGKLRTAILAIKQQSSAKIDNQNAMNALKIAIETVCVVLANNIDAIKNELKNYSDGGATNFAAEQWEKHLNIILEQLNWLITKQTDDFDDDCLRNIFKLSADIADQLDPFQFCAHHMDGTPPMILPDNKRTVFFEYDKNCNITNNNQAGGDKNKIILYGVKADADFSIELGEQTQEISRGDGGGHIEYPHNLGENSWVALGGAIIGFGSCASGGSYVDSSEVVNSLVYNSSTVSGLSLVVNSHVFNSSSVRQASVARDYSQICNNSDALNGSSVSEYSTLNHSRVSGGSEIAEISSIVNSGIYSETFVRRSSISNSPGIFACEIIDSIVDSSIIMNDPLNDSKMLIENSMILDSCFMEDFPKNALDANSVYYRGIKILSRGKNGKYEKILYEKENFNKLAERYNSQVKDRYKNYRNPCGNYDALFSEGIKKAAETLRREIKFLEEKTANAREQEFYDSLLGKKIRRKIKFLTNDA